MTQGEEDPDFDELLGRLRAADPARDPRWDALAEGKLSAEEARAAQESCERGDSPAGAHEAFQPMSAERRAAILSNVLRGDGGESLATAQTRKPTSYRRKAIVIASALSLAAAIAMFFVFRSPPPLPVYALFIEGGATVRGTPRAPVSPEAPVELHLSPGGRARITLAPTTAVRGGVEARFFVASAGAVRPWSPATRVTEQGTIEIDDVRAERMPSDPGARQREIDLWIALARPGRMPGDEALIAQIGARGTASEAQLLRVHLLFDEAPR